MLGIGLGALPARSAYSLIPAIAFLLILPCYAIGMSLPPRPPTFVFFRIPAALQLAWLESTITAVQQLVPPNMRSMTSASFLFINNLHDLSLGSPLIGLASDPLAKRFCSESLRYALLGDTGFYVLAQASSCSLRGTGRATGPASSLSNLTYLTQGLCSL